MLPFTVTFSKPECSTEAPGQIAAPHDRPGAHVREPDRLRSAGACRRHTARGWLEPRRRGFADAAHAEAGPTADHVLLSNVFAILLRRLGADPRP